MPPDATAADTGFLSIDEAVANLDAADKREDEAPAVAAVAPSKTNTEAEPAAEVANEPETATDGENAETEDTGEADEANLSAIEPPRFWDAEAKARFNELPRDLQELVLSKETEHDRATATKFEEAAAARKAADAEASRLGAYTAKLDKLVPQAEQTFASRWGEGEIDWARVAREQGVETAFTLKTQHDQEKSSLETLKVAQQEIAAENTKKFISERLVKLQTTCPDLVDPKAGNDRQLELVKFWVGLGKNANQIINQADDVELSVLYDAMLMRQARAKAQQQSNAPRTQAKPAVAPKPSVRPTAAPGRAGSPQLARIQTLQRKPSLTTDELVELMDLQET